VLEIVLAGYRLTFVASFNLTDSDSKAARRSVAAVSADQWAAMKRDATNQSG
jgi:hypothetical protein